MFESPLFPWQQIYHLAFLFSFLEQLLKFLVNFTLLKYVKSQRNYGFLIIKELIFGFQILDLKYHFSDSLTSIHQYPRDLVVGFWASSRDFKMSKRQRRRQPPRRLGRRSKLTSWFSAILH